MYKNDSSLAHLGFKMKQPPKEFQSWIQCFWSIEASLEKVHQEILYPDGGNSLVVDLEENTWFLDKDPATWKTQTFGGKVKMMGVRFLPGMLSSLLQKPVNTIQGHEARFAEAAQCEEIISLESFILQKIWDLRKNANHAEHLQEAVHNIATNLSEFQKANLVGKVGSCTRQTERIFQTSVGVGPKMIQNMLRIRQARHRIKAFPSQSLTQLALDLGYFDQSHFCRFFKRFTGTSPKKYASRALARCS